MPRSDPESRRLAEAESRGWRRWGPYLAERQWGTVREDYSADGRAWEHLGFDQARSRAYRWGEDGLAGFSDSEQRLCLSLALWNRRDPILKERLFGLSNPEGNHGEDVKELYYYLDATPTHSYCRMLYKYPQAAFPYERLRDEARRRGRDQPELELLDTGVFDGDRYFDVFVEYAKADVDDLLLRITVHNRGPEAAPLVVLPQLWFRNTWSWGRQELGGRPELAATGASTLGARHPTLGELSLQAATEPAPPELLFCENETNVVRLFGQRAAGPFKDGFHDYLVEGRGDAVSHDGRGTKAAALYRLELAAGASSCLRLRLVSGSPPPLSRSFDELLERRRKEADAFYAGLQEGLVEEDARRIQRQALAGMIWSKQFYYYDVAQWLDGDPAQPAPPAGRGRIRNGDWFHLNNADVISMPDTWEYPWYAAWDLAFHCVAFAMIDPEFAKEQLVLLTREWFMHPNGQLPAYEWALGDVNPPVHAWACWRVFQIDRKHHRGDERGDLAFLERVFHKALLNFTWWVNRKDPQGRNLFQGGFLGLDNIGVFDRSKPLPTGGTIDQADGTSWMAMYSLVMMRMALELAGHNPVYEDVATKFFEHFLYIAAATTHIGGDGVSLWDPEDEFFYDVLVQPDGRALPLKVRSMVGLIPLFAVETLEPEQLERAPQFARRMEWFLEHRPDLAALVSRWWEEGRGARHLLSLLRGHRMKRLLRRMLDEQEFLSPYGVRSLSRYHLDHPYAFNECSGEWIVSYQPGESASALFGGNSNWRGPVWFPLNFLIIESLQKFHHYYTDDFRVECPTGSGRLLTINQIAEELTARLTRLFLRDGTGRRPAMGPKEKLQTDPHFADHLLFHEYFHGEDGRGLGASHQTGWTGLIAKLIRPRRPEAK